jgi:predicted permease
MNNTQSLFEGVVVLFLIILIAVFLKKRGILNKEMSVTFSQLILNVTLPAVVFSSLALRVFDSRFLTMSLIMAVIELSVIFIAWGIASLFRFERGEKGALMLVSAFGMTAFLGYPLIRQVFPGDAMAMEEAVVTSEVGVGLLLFVLGPIIAKYYGDSGDKVEGNMIMVSLKKFFTTPLFFALAGGILFSLLHIKHEGLVFNIVFRALKFMGNANLFLVAITIGLIFEPKKLSNMVLFVALALSLKLLVKPAFAYWLTNNGFFTDMMREIVFIETALPTAILTAVFAKQYNCKPDLVSTTIMVGLVISLATMSLSFLIFF